MRPAPRDHPIETPVRRTPLKIGTTTASEARDIEEPLAVTGEQCDQHGGSARVQVDVPGHRGILSQREDVAYQLQQFRLVVWYSA